MLILGSKQYASISIMNTRVSSPKNENSVSICSPSSCSKPLCVYLFCWTQRKIFGRMFQSNRSHSPL